MYDITEWSNPVRTITVKNKNIDYTISFQLKKMYLNVLPYISHKKQTKKPL